MKMKGILKRLATLTIMAALVLCLLPMMSMTAFAESNSATYTDGVYALEVTNYDEYMKTGTHVRSIELLGIENVDISINTSNQIVCSFKLRFIDAIEQECTTDYSFSFTVENKSCTEAISHSFEATYGKGSSTTYVVTKGTLTRAARTEHTGDATCIAKAKCSVCGEEYGAVNPDAHIWGDWTYSNGKHSRTCTLNGTHKESANCTRGENDRCTVCETNLVASLTSGDTTTYYKTVDEAFAAAQAAGSGTVTVLANAEYTREKPTVPIIYPKNISLVVNPNVTLTTEAFLRLRGSISGGGTIAGTNQGWLIAYDGSTIEGITATAGLNIAGGTVLSGTFAGEVQSDGTIKGGTFSGMVYNSGTIEGGTFSETVVNHDFYYGSWAGTISGGTFNCTVENTPGTINGGTFNGQLTNKPYGEPYSEYESYVEATVDADKLTLGENFSFTNQGGTVTCNTHQRTTPATCMAPETCIFCGHTEGEKDNTAHSLSYSAADNVITETCAHGCAAPATATLAINTGSVTYNGTAQTIETSIPHSATWRGERLTAQYENNTNVGTATVYIQAGEAKAVKTFEITKAAPTLEHFDIALPQNAVYDGDPKPATVKLKDGYTGAGEIQIKYYQGENYLGSAPTDAGTYAVKFSVADGTNFNAMELTEAGSFTIAKAETVNTAPVAIQNLVYDGSELALITAGEVTGAAQAAGYKMMYMLEEEGAVYTDTIPVATDAGTYKIIWYAGYDNDNFIMNSGTMEVTIAKADIDYTAPTAETLTYNTKQQYLVSGGDSRLQYKLDNGEWSDTIPYATNAGDYTVYYRTNMGDNYNNVPETPISAKIAPFNFATAEGSQVGLVENSFVYDGTAKTGNISAKVEFQNTEPQHPIIEVTLTKGTDFTLTYENNVKVGTATATFTGKGNYTGVITDTFEITKAPLTLTVEDQTITYGEEIDQSKYSVTGLAAGDTATVTLTPSTTDITKSGSITAEITIKNAAGEDVTACYTVATSAAGLVIDPDLSAIKDLTVENVHYSSESAIKGLQDALNDATEDTATQDAIKDAKVKCAQLLTQINESLDALETDEINATLSTTASNVKLTDKANVTKAIADIKAAKEKFDGNYSDEEIETLDKQIAQLEAALKAIGNAEAVIAELNDMPAEVEPDDDAAIKAKAAYEKLTSNERSMVNSVAAAKVAALTNYKIVKGDKGTWKDGTLTFTINGDHDRFTGVQVNGKAISKSYYSSKSGSTIVTLKESYIKTISSQATHKITFLFNDGTVEGTFYIHKDAMTPATGDEANIVLYSAVFAVSLAALVALFLVSKKRKQENS